LTTDSASSTSTTPRRLFQPGFSVAANAGLEFLGGDSGLPSSSVRLMVVLIRLLLGDRDSEKRKPFGFPPQHVLRRMTRLSRSGLKEALARLESMRPKHVQRVTVETRDRRNRTARRSLYVLAVPYWAHFEQDVRSQLWRECQAALGTLPLPFDPKAPVAALLKEQAERLMKAAGAESLFQNGRTSGPFGKEGRNSGHFGTKVAGPEATLAFCDAQEVQQENNSPGGAEGAVVTSVRPAAEEPATAAAPPPPDGEAPNGNSGNGN